MASRNVKRVALVRHADGCRWEEVEYLEHDPTAFGQTARATRLDAYLAIGEVAHRLGESPAELSGIERGVQLPDEGLARRWAELLDADPDEWARLARGESGEVGAS